MASHILRGVLAGAAGTTALNTATYLDMALRARPGSSTPEQTVKTAEDQGGVALSAEGSDSETAQNRRQGIGPLMGVATGVGSGVVYGAVRRRCPHAPATVMALLAGAIANVGSVAPMSAMGITDPRSWPASSWIMDVVPHLVYGATTAIAYDMFTAGKRGRRR